MAKRYTNEERARDLHDLLRRIRLTTVDPTIYRQAHEAGELASAAVGAFNNARAMDADFGGGSSVAWSDRSKGSRWLAKARKILQGIGDDTAKAPRGTPSIANVLFLRRVAEKAHTGERFRALMVDKYEFDPCVGAGWIEMRAPNCDPYWVLTAAGSDILARFSDLAEGIEAA